MTYDFEGNQILVKDPEKDLNNIYITSAYRIPPSKEALIEKVNVKKSKSQAPDKLTVKRKRRDSSTSSFSIRQKLAVLSSKQEEYITLNPQRVLDNFTLSSGVSLRAGTYTLKNHEDDPNSVNIEGKQRFKKQYFDENMKGTHKRIRLKDENPLEASGIPPVKDPRRTSKLRMRTKSPSAHSKSSSRNMKVNEEVFQDFLKESKYQRPINSKHLYVKDVAEIVGNEKNLVLDNSIVFAQHIAERRASIKQPNYNPVELLDQKCIKGRTHNGGFFKSKKRYASRERGGLNKTLYTRRNSNGERLKTFCP